MLKYDTLILDALSSIPEFKERYEKLIKLDEIDRESGVHIVFAYAFVPVLIDAYKKQDERLLKKMFDFLEQMVLSTDKECASVCDFSVIEAINGEIPDDVLLSYMGKETKLDFLYMKQEIGYLA